MSLAAFLGSTEMTVHPRQAPNTAAATGEIAPVEGDETDATPAAATNASCAAIAAGSPTPRFVFDGGGLLGGTPLGSDVLPDPAVFQIERGGAVLRQLSISPARAGAHPHFHGAAYNVLMAGLRRWALIPPRSAEFSALHAIAYFESLRSGRWQHEADAKAERTHGTAPPEWIDSGVQRRGELLYVPEQWGHATLSLSDSVAVAVEFV